MPLEGAKSQRISRRSFSCKPPPPRGLYSLLLLLGRRTLNFYFILHVPYFLSFSFSWFCDWFNNQWLDFRFTSGASGIGRGVLMLVRMLSLRLVTTKITYTQNLQTSNFQIQPRRLSFTRTLHISSIDRCQILFQILHLDHCKLFKAWYLFSVATSPAL